MRDNSSVIVFIQTRSNRIRIDSLWNCSPCKDLPDYLCVAVITPSPDEQHTTRVLSRLGLDVLDLGWSYVLYLWE
jgi:hypothetical protein